MEPPSIDWTPIDAAATTHAARFGEGWLISYVDDSAGGLAAAMVYVPDAQAFPPVYSTDLNLPEVPF